MSGKKFLRRFLVIVCFVPLIALCAYWGVQVHNLASEREAIKRDYSAINAIGYGILSVDVWKQNMEEILTNGIRGFELTQAQRDTLEAAITDVIKTTIVRADSVVRSNHTFKGKLRTMVYSVVIDKEQFMKKAPVFSHGIVEEALKQKNKERIKNVAVEKLYLFAEQTYGDTLDIVRMMPTLVKYHVANREAFNKLNTERMSYLQAETYHYTFLMTAVVVFFLLGWFVLYKVDGVETLFFSLSVLVALIVLLVGITSPMIEIDARLAKMEFTFLGGHLQFDDQILFYQSKSMMEVVKILIKTGSADSMVVGILILTFSILFPITKLLCTQVYLFGKEKMKQNKVIYFFAFKSGKWSMADVMVVAIFMAYIGFQGILNSQLKTLNYDTPSLRSIATNLTSLQPAFILFVAFVLYGLILSEILKRIHKRNVSLAEAVR